jgi:hypothetical protein
MAAGWHHPPSTARSMMQALVALQIQGLQALGAILVMLLLLIAVALSSSFPELCVPVVPRLWIFSPQGEQTNKIVRTREIFILS